MFSATWPKEVRNLAADFQKNAAYLNVGSLELAANHDISQVVEVIDEYEKQNRMMTLLADIMSQVRLFLMIWLVGVSVALSGVKCASNMFRLNAKPLSSRKQNAKPMTSLVGCVGMGGLHFAFTEIRTRENANGS